MLRIECDVCYEEAEYECEECYAALCAGHARVSSEDACLYCPECDENLREGSDERKGARGDHSDME